MVAVEEDEEAEKEEQGDEGVEGSEGEKEIIWKLCALHAFPNEVGGEGRSMHCFAHIESGMDNRHT